MRRVDGWPSDDKRFLCLAWAVDVSSKFTNPCLQASQLSALRHVSVTQNSSFGSPQRHIERGWHPAMKLTVRLVAVRPVLPASAFALAAIPWAARSSKDHTYQPHVASIPEGRSRLVKTPGPPRALGAEALC